MMFNRPTAWQRPTARRRSVLGMVAVLWLNMAVLPCAMAFQNAAPCPHCPPADEHEMMSHHGHGGDRAEPATTQSECCDLDEAKVDARVNKLESKPASVVAFVTAPAIAELPELTAAQQHCGADPPGHSGGSPPIHVLICVYLD